MTHVTSKQAVTVWFALVFATLSVGWLVEYNKFSAQWTVVLVLLVAYLKARGIVLYYMEVKHAPYILRLIFEAWLLVVSGLILTMWMLQA